MKPIHNCNGYYIDSNGDIYSNKKGYLIQLKPYTDSQGHYKMIKLITNNGKRKII